MSKYVKPYDQYEDGEVMICCPQCGDPSDYCQDHSHWLCPDCGESLEINENVTPAEWHCAVCDEGVHEPPRLINKDDPELTQMAKNMQDSGHLIIHIL